jgi:hypothetical protein
VRGDGNEQRLEYPIGTVLHRTSGWVSSPRISRDGRRVAFADHPIVGDDQGHVAVVEAGSPVRRLSGPMNFLHGIAWTADGREVVASFGTADEGAFLSAFAPGTPPRTLLRTVTRTRLLDIAPSGAILLSSDSFSVSVEGRLAGGLPTGRWSGSGAAGSRGANTRRSPTGERTGPSRSARDWPPGSRRMAGGPSSTP